MQVETFRHLANKTARLRALLWLEAESSSRAGVPNQFRRASLWSVG